MNYLKFIRKRAFNIIRRVRKFTNMAVRKLFSLPTKTPSKLIGEGNKGNSCIIDTIGENETNFTQKDESPSDKKIKKLKQTIKMLQSYIMSLEELSAKSSEKPIPMERQPSKIKNINMMTKFDPKTIDNSDIVQVSTRREIEDKNDSNGSYSDLEPKIYIQLYKLRQCGASACDFFIKAAFKIAAKDPTFSIKSVLASTESGDAGFFLRNI